MVCRVDTDCASVFLFTKHFRIPVSNLNTLKSNTIKIFSFRSRILNRVIRQPLYIFCYLVHDRIHVAYFVVDIVSFLLPGLKFSVIAISVTCNNIGVIYIYIYIYIYVMFAFPCIISLYCIKNQQDATLAVLFISNCKITPHVSDAFCVHHQEY